MQKRSIALALAVTVTSLGGLALTTMSNSAARAADECLTAPKGATPAGAHWYYRLEKGTKRKCWYLADEASRPAKTKSSAATPATASSEASPPPAAKPRTARRSVADARAELTTPEDDQPALAATIWPPIEPSAATDTAPADTPPVIADATSTPKSWTMAARWPESNAVSTESSPPDAQPAAPLRTDAAPHEATIDPLRIALIVLTIALLAAAIAGRLLLRKARRTPRPAKSRTIWPDERSDDPALPFALPSTATAHGVRPTHASPEMQRVSADIEKIEKLLRASRGATG